MADFTRDIYDAFDAWFKSPRRKPLLVRGARQVGKSYAIRAWASTAISAAHYLEINLEEQTSLHKIFQGDHSAEQVVQDLQLTTGINLRKPGALLFVDEIQAEPKAITTLRYLHEQLPSLAVIAAGSLIEFTLAQTGLPVGRVEQLQMYPVSFLEFLQALGNEQLATYIKQASLDKPLSEVAHDQLLRTLREYYYVGGMPEAVAAYIDTKELSTVSEIHAQLLMSFRNDFPKYSRQTQWDTLQLVFDVAPIVVGESRVKYVRFDRTINGEKIKSAVELLERAKVLTKITSTYAAQPPLRASAQRKFFKLLFLDIGLLHHSLGFDWRNVDIQADLTNICDGKFAEQFVGQELLAGDKYSNIPELFYWYRAVKGSDAEVDYVINSSGAPCPIEVKSGKRGTLKSLSLYIDKFNPPHSYVLSQRNIESSDKITWLPLYLASQLLRSDNT